MLKSVLEGSVSRLVVRIVSLHHPAPVRLGSLLTSHTATPVTIPAPLLLLSAETHWGMNLKPPVGNSKKHFSTCHFLLYLCEALWGRSEIQARQLLYLLTLHLLPLQT